MVSLARVFGAFQEGSFYIASFLLVLSVVVFVHEYGHYSVAKMCGVRVKTFSLGFGPELFGVTDGSGTRWKFSLVPVGGYVKMLGDAQEDKLSEGERSFAFNEKPLWQRFAIAGAGPAANLLFSVLVFFILFSTRGIMSPMPIVGSVLPGGAAERIGLMVGDRIIEVDGHEVSWFEEIRHYIAGSSSKELTIVFLRDGEVHSVKLSPDVWSDDARKLGIAASVSPETTRARRLPVLHSAAESFRCIFRIVKITLLAIIQLVTGARGVDELGGPVRIAKHSGESIRNKEGLWFVGLISANLGVVNLLPIPMLDGGYMLQYALQGILRRRTIDPKYQNVMMAIGFVLLVSMMVFVTFNDVRSILK
ncbi:M50 family metallopeptidase [Anaplasma capra]|nr:M50 family metallopeptidase [Anaplasma capra]MCU7611275.1 M50 family metallopeptidase [Anaplasma capra]MCU7612704.1 M50 family metallopeptidase [Anaplasma capra]